MLIVTLKDALLFDFLLMLFLYRVEIVGSCTAEDGVELIKALHLAVIVLSVPVLTKEFAVVCTYSLTFSVLVRVLRLRCAVGKTGCTPLLVRP